MQDFLFNFSKNLLKSLISDCRVNYFIMFLDLGLGKKIHYLILVSSLANSKLWRNHGASSNCIYSRLDVISGGNMMLPNHS